MINFIRGQDQSGETAFNIPAFRSRQYGPSAAKKTWSWVT